ncbi:P-loop containing nucleoside triphosphate hydrolase protein [Aspergillus novoparasiticus]|uniref:P-loop containing nucleoside triphosphate hydrolase protein n=1 Tax=Aspergillus novoparasiticus TaxID=986946 RepID=A0A5N6EMN6_9EURO|nr:P-loop containing nucleoside triphosphate hydrolase protein [Aspergillus novoparasiticus]
MSDFLYSMAQQELSTQIKYVAVMGMTGVGKTTFITTLTGDSLTVGHGLSSCTKNINVAETFINGQRVHLIDTPGFDDTDLSDTEILKTIATYLQGEEGANIQLTGLLYLHRISDVRMQGSALKNIRMFRSLIGENNMANVVLVTTRWDSVTRDEGVSRLRELLEKDKFWGGMIAAGARHEALLNVEVDCQRIVQKFGANRAGQVVSAELRKMEQQHAEEIAELKETLRVEKDSEIAHQLRAAYEEMMQKQERIAEEQKRLHQAEMRQLQHQIRNLKHTHHSSLM